MLNNVPSGCIEDTKVRRRIFDIIEIARDNDRLSKVYDITMMIVIVLSLLPIALKNSGGMVGEIEMVTTGIFIVDYILRMATADFKLNKGGKSFALYPFTPMAIIDLLSILPSLIAINGAFRILKVLRLLRTLRVFRVFKVIRYSKSISIIINVFKKQKESLLVVCGFAVGYILVSALVVISIEPETFPTFFDAVYWATVSLTTVGYGDIYAVSMAGKIITMISSICGIGIVALPAGIVTAGYMDELQSDREKENHVEKMEGTDYANQR